MARPGLALPSTDFDPFTGGSASGLNQFDPFTSGPAQLTGLRDMTNLGVADVSGLMPPPVQFAPPPIPAAAPTPTGPEILYNPNTQQFSVNGFTFRTDNASRALESQDWLSAPPTPPPGQGWVAAPTEYQTYINNIKNPSLGTMFGTGVRRGLTSSQLLAGATLQLVGAERLGSQIVDDANRTIQKDAPFQRQVLRSQDAGDVAEWAFSAVGEALPTMAEMAAMWLVGAGGATLAAPGLKAGAETLARFAVKEETKNLIRSGIAKRAAGAALSAEETRAIAGAARIVGGAAAVAAGNYQMGVGDTYNSLREAGADPNSFGSRLLALGAGVPYAALETAPEAYLFKRAFMHGAEGNLLRRVASTAGKSALLEGTTEAGQEVITRGAASSESGKPFFTDENVHGIIEAGLAGALPGALFGGLAGINKSDPVNLVGPGATPSGGFPNTSGGPVGPAPTTPPTRTYSVGSLFPGVDSTPSGPTGPAQTPSRPGVVDRLRANQPGVARPDVNVAVTPNSMEVPPDPVVGRLRGILMRNPQTRGAVDPVGVQNDAVAAHEAEVERQALEGVMQDEPPAPAQVGVADRLRGILAREPQTKAVLDAAAEAKRAEENSTPAARRLRAEQKFDEELKDRLAQHENRSAEAEKVTDTFTLSDGREVTVRADGRTGRTGDNTFVSDESFYADEDTANRIDGMINSMGYHTDRRDNRTLYPSIFVKDNKVLFVEPSGKIYGEVPVETVPRAGLVLYERNINNGGFKREGTIAKVGKQGTPPPKGSASKETTDALLASLRKNQEALDKEPNAHRKSAIAATIKAQEKMLREAGVPEEVINPPLPSVDTTPLDGLKDRALRRYARIERREAKRRLKRKLEAASGEATRIVEQAAVERPAPAPTENGEARTDGMEVRRIKRRTPKDEGGGVAAIKRATRELNKAPEEPPTPRRRIGLKKPQANNEARPEASNNSSPEVKLVNGYYVADPETGEALVIHGSDEAWEYAKKLDPSGKRDSRNPTRYGISPVEGRSGQYNIIDNQAYELNRPKNTVQDPAPPLPNEDTSNKAQALAKTIIDRLASGQIKDYKKALFMHRRSGKHTKEVVDAAEAILDAHPIYGKKEIGAREPTADDYTPGGKTEQKARKNAGTSADPTAEAAARVEAERTAAHKKLVAAVRKAIGTVPPISTAYKNVTQFLELLNEYENNPSSANLSKLTQFVRDNTAFATYVARIEGFAEAFNKLVNPKETKLSAAPGLTEELVQKYFDRQVEAENHRYDALRKHTKITDIAHERKLSLIEARRRNALGYVANPESKSLAQNEVDEILQWQDRENNAERNKLLAQRGDTSRKTDKLGVGRPATLTSLLRKTNIAHAEDGITIKNPISRLKLERIVNRYVAQQQALKIHHYKSVIVDSDEEFLAELDAETAASLTPNQRLEAAVTSDGKLVIHSKAFYTTGHLRFVLGHEIAGHIGLAGITTPAERVAILKELMSKLPGFKERVEAKLHLYEGIKKNEGGVYDIYDAAEEALADMAGALESSWINHIWFSVKNWFSRSLRMKFHDDVARYILSHMRYYARTGQRPVMTEEALMEVLQKVVDIEGYSRAPTALLTTDRLSLGDNAYPDDAYDLGPLTNAAAAAIHGDMANSAESIQQAYDHVRTLGGRFGRYLGRALDYVQTTTNLARKSEGLTMVLGVFEQIGRMSTDLLSKYQMMTITARTPSGKRNGVAVGSTEKERHKAGEILGNTSMHLMNKMTDEEIGKQRRILETNPDGQIVVNEEVVQRHLDAGILSAEQISNGIELEYSSGLPAGEYKTAVSDSDTAYKIYVENRKAIGEAAKQRLIGAIAAFQDAVEKKMDAKLAAAKASNPDGTQLTAAQRQWFDKVMRTYLHLVVEAAKIDGVTENNYQSKKRFADQWLAAVLRITHKDIGALKLSDWENGATTNIPEGTDAKVAAKIKKENDFVNQVRALPNFEDLMRDILNHASREKIPGITENFDKQKVLNEVFSTNVLQFKEIIEREKAVIRTLRGGYVPIKRTGKFEVRIIATTTDGNGKPRIVKLNRDIADTLPYFLVEHREGIHGEQKGAVQIAEELNNALGGREWKLRDTRNQDVKVTLTAVYAEARTGAALGDRVDFSDFARVLDAANVNLTPVDTAKIIQLLEKTQSSVRRSMQRSGTPGWNHREVLDSVDEHLGVMARTRARAQYRHLLDDILNNRTNWYGDEAKLDKLRDEYLADPTDLNKQQRYHEYAFKYSHMADSEPGDNTFEVHTPQGVRKIKKLGEGGRSFDHAANLLEFYAREPDVNVTVDNWLSKTGPLKALTTATLLGGSFASAALNLTSMPLNVLSYLSGMNAKTGFGGGFGASAARAELVRGSVLASKLVLRLDDRQSLSELTEAEWAKLGVLPDEAAAILDATATGDLTPASVNALIGSQTAKIRHVVALDLIKKWLYPFTKTETGSRLASFIAAYRLYKARAIASGADPLSFEDTKSENHKYAMARARETLDRALVNFSLYNRPAFFRGPVGDLLYVFKQFPVGTVELLSNLSTKQKAQFCAVLFVMAGAKGMPFAEDLMDLLDTLMQMLGVKSRGVELETRAFLEQLFPGTSKYVMNGFLNSMTGATISTRTGFGDIIPFTGAGRKGADVAQELKQGAGPVIGAALNTADFAVQLADYMVLQKGLNPFAVPGKNTLTDVLRNAPVVGVKNLVEGSVMFLDGQVTDRNGKLVTPEMNLAMGMSRILGFYPAAATEQNDVIRLSRYADSYVKAIRMRYQNAYVAAMVRKDTRRANEVVQQVEEYNRGAHGDFYIEDFKQRADRALGEARRTAVGRYYKTLRRGASGQHGPRDTAEELAASYGLDPKSDQ